MRTAARGQHKAPKPASSHDKEHLLSAPSHLDQLAARFTKLLLCGGLESFRPPSRRRFGAELEYLFPIHKHVPPLQRAAPTRRLTGLIFDVVVLDDDWPCPQACCIRPRPRRVQPGGLHAHQDAAHLARTTLIHPEYPIHRA